MDSYSPISTDLSTTSSDSRPLLGEKLGLPSTHSSVRPVAGVHSLMDLWTDLRPQSEKVSIERPDEASR